MQVTFPAMRGQIGGREYFATIMALSEIPRFFKFNDWEQFTPELRAQRVLNESRVPVISKYIVDNEDSYIFSSITASYNAKIDFMPASESTPNVGSIRLNLEEMEFVINDGQHRCAAIAAALKDSPSLAKDRISVLLFPTEDLERMQQMFSDLNRFAQRTSKSINILYDHRDSLAALTIEIIERVDAFRGLVDRERISIPVRSEKLFTLSTIYDANKELLGKLDCTQGSEEYRKSVDKAVTYWDSVSDVMKDWKRVSSEHSPASSVRQEKISTHAVVMRALGGIGRMLFEQEPENWRENLKRLSSIDWRKSVGSKVNTLWDGVCITAGSVISNRQARLATLDVLSRTVGIVPKPPRKKKKKRGRRKKNREG